MPTAVWMAVMHLRAILPSDATLGLQIYHVPSQRLDITEGIRLGGEYCPWLLGPTPRGLVPAGVPHQQVNSGWPEAYGGLPDGVKPTPEALDPANWVVDASD